MSIYTMTDANKIQYTSLILKYYAKVWWQMLYRTPQVLQTTWVNFKRAFELEYLSLDIIYVKAQEFLYLS